MRDLKEKNRSRVETRSFRRRRERRRRRRYERSHRLRRLRREVNFHERARGAAANSPVFVQLPVCIFSPSYSYFHALVQFRFCKQVAHFIPPHLRPIRRRSFSRFTRSSMCAACARRQVKWRSKERRSLARSIGGGLFVRRYGRRVS